MDGNRRWAKKNKLETIKGHRQGALNLLNLLDVAIQYKVNSVTAYTLSWENLNSRNNLEINSLFKMIDSLSYRIDEINDKGALVKVLGETSKIPQKTKEVLQKAELVTSKNKGILLQFCINYGGRQEILRAVKKLTESNEEVTLDNLEKHLYTSIEPDLIIRTGGHQRLSNFLSWQSAYSEFYFTDTLWPDFDKKELEKAIEFFRLQKRNFGR